MIMATSNDQSRYLAEEDLENLDGAAGEVEEQKAEKNGCEVASRRVKRQVFIDTMMTIYGLKKSEKDRRELLFRL